MQEKSRAGRKNLQRKSAKRRNRAEAKRHYLPSREEVSESDQCLDKEVFRLQNQKEKLDERLENQVNYMWNEYELTYSTAERFLQSGDDLRSRTQKAD